MGESGTGIWSWVVEKLIPPLAIAGAGAIITVALTVRDNSHALADLRGRADLAESNTERESASRASECAAVQARLGALEARLAVEETRGMAHETEAAEWKERIRRCESGGGTAGRCEIIESRLRTLEEYRAVDEHRMSKIEARIDRTSAAEGDP